MARNKILVVEDNPLQLKLVTTILEKEGYHVCPKTDGLEALRVAESFKPDLLLLDINMPNISGVEMCKKFKENPENLEVPVLFLTAYKEPELILEAFKAGAIDYIPKPFNRDEIIARVRAQIKYRQLADEKLELIKALDRASNERMLGQLSIGLAHNFNNMLTSAMGYTQLIEMTTKEVDNKTRVEVVKKVLQEMHKMVSNLAEFSDRGEMLTSNINLLSFIQERTDVFVSTSIPNLEVKIQSQLPAEELNLELDAKSFTTCIFNILKNSEENSGGKKANVLIEILKTQLPEHVRARNTGDNLGKSFICIRFTDDGVGLGNLKHPYEIFQPFWTTKKTVGVGLGLSVVHGFITRLRGYTDAHNANELGTVIELFIPCP